MIPKKGKEWKKEKLQKFENLVKSNKYFVFFNFIGLNIPSFLEIKKKMNELGNQVMVVKNVFIKMLMNVRFEEPIAVISISKDPIKTIKELIKILDKEKIRGSVLDNVFYDSQKTLDLSNSPDSDELRGMLIGSLYSVLHNLLSCLKWYPSTLLYILDKKASQQRS